MQKNNDLENLLSTEKIFSDNKKAFDGIPNKWKVKARNIFKISQVIIKFLKFNKEMCYTNLRSIHKKGTKLIMWILIMKYSKMIHFTNFFFLFCFILFLLSLFEISLSAEHKNTMFGYKTT